MIFISIPTVRYNLGNWYNNWATLEGHHFHNLILKIYLMQVSPQNLAQQHTVKQLKHLLNAVQETKKKFESFASMIKNTQLNQFIMSLALENNQYAGELKSLIRSLGGESEIKEDKNKVYINSQVAENDILDACETSGKHLMNIYKNVMKESYIYDSLKKMIGNQLNGITCTFHRLKLLNKLQK